MISREPPIERLAIARSFLLEPYGLTEATLAKALGSIATHRIDDADLYFQYTRSEGWSLEEGIVKSGSFGIDQGVGVRAVAGEKTAFAYSDDISEAALMDAAATVRSIAAAAERRQATAVRETGQAEVSPDNPSTSGAPVDLGGWCAMPAHRPPRPRAMGRDQEIPSSAQFDTLVPHAEQPFPLAPDSFESRRHAGTIRVEADGRIIGRNDEDETDLSLLTSDASRLRAGTTASAI